jgi:hypothetical protein
MLGHTGIAVADFNRSKAFYERALSPLSIVLVMEVTAEQSGGGAHAGFGTGGKPFFWIGDGGRLAGQVHIAFTARSRTEVDAFHRAGLDAGGKNNHTTTPTTMARSSSIRTGTTSKPSVTSHCDGRRGALLNGLGKRDLKTPNLSPGRTEGVDARLGWGSKPRARAFPDHVESFDR